jgi:hypothetical protein
MPKLAIINVGVNASHGKLQSPLFDDETFEFVPIPERGRYSDAVYPSGTCYRDLDAFNKGGRLLDYIPNRYHNVWAHNDPEFKSFTYGDYPGRSPRAANLKRLEPGDYLFFLARLVKWKDGEFTRDAGFFLVGYLEIEEILRDVTSELSAAQRNRVINNAHVQRALGNRECYDRFWVFRGSEGSVRFKYAVPFDRAFVEQVIPNADQWEWKPSWTNLQTIGCYTRTCKLIDSEPWVAKFLARIEGKSVA